MDKLWRSLDTKRKLWDLFVDEGSLTFIKEKVMNDFVKSA